MDLKTNNVILEWVVKVSTNYNERGWIILMQRRVFCHKYTYSNTIICFLKATMFKALLETIILINSCYTTIRITVYHFLRLVHVLPLSPHRP